MPARSTKYSLHPRSHLIQLCPLRTPDHVYYCYCMYTKSIDLLGLFPSNHYGDGDPPQTDDPLEKVELGHESSPQLLDSVVDSTVAQ
jgi:hypothetical protein